MQHAAYIKRKLNSILSFFIEFLKKPEKLLFNLESFKSPSKVRKMTLGLHVFILSICLATACVQERASHSAFRLVNTNNQQPVQFAASRFDSLKPNTGLTVQPTTAADKDKYASVNAFIDRIKLPTELTDEDETSDLDEVYVKHIIDSPRILDKFFAKFLQELNKIKVKGPLEQDNEQSVDELLNKLSSMRSSLTL